MRMKKGCPKNMATPPQSQQKPQQIHEIVHFLCRKKQLLLHCLLESNTWMVCMYFSQSYLARRIGVSRKTINEWIGLFVELNLIHKYYRQSKTCTYEIAPWLLEGDTQDWLKDFYRSFFKLSLALLLSISAASANVTELTFKGFNLSNCTVTTVQKRTSTNEAKLLYEHDPTWCYQACTCTGCTTEAFPNQKRSYLEFEAILESTNMSQELLPFTQEQLGQLTQYSKESIEYANKIVTKDLHSGKAIHNQFNYFLSIVKAYQEKTHKRDGSGASQQRPRASTFTPYVEGGKWVPGARIINNDHNYQTTITHVETDREFALNYEKEIHRLTQMTQEELDLAQPNFKGISMQQRAKFNRCPIWSKFSPEEQRMIWNLAHGSACKCRKNEDAGLIMPDIAQKLIDNIPAKPDLDSEIAYNPDLYEEVF
jgi:hypothetical protein